MTLPAFFIYLTLGNVAIDGRGIVILRQGQCAPKQINPAVQSPPCEHERNIWAKDLSGQKK